MLMLVGNISAINIIFKLKTDSRKVLELLCFWFALEPIHRLNLSINIHVKKDEASSLGFDEVLECNTCFNPSHLPLSPTSSVIISHDNKFQSR